MSVPAKVAAKGTATVRRRDTLHPPQPPYLTENTSGWRFQLRLSLEFFADALRARFALAGHAPVVRIQIGARRRGEAWRLAQQRAAICQVVCAAAALKSATTMDNEPLDPSQSLLVRRWLAPTKTPSGRR